MSYVGPIWKTEHEREDENHIAFAHVTLLWGQRFHSTQDSTIAGGSVCAQLHIDTCLATSELCYPYLLALAV